MTSSDDRLLGSARQITPEMRESWARADRIHARRQLIVRLVLAAVLVIAAAYAQAALR